MVFYNPFVMRLGEVPAIVYPAKDEGRPAFDRGDSGCIERYFQHLWDFNRELISGANPDYIIGVAWGETTGTKPEDEKITMADFFLNSNADGKYGPSLTILNFRNCWHYLPDPRKGEFSLVGNELAMLGAEEELRVEIGDLKKYLEGPRPQLPERLRVGEDFYLVGDR